MNREHYHHGNLRALLIEKAVNVLDQKGPDGLSLRALAREIGVSHAAPARHFKNKEALIRALADEGIDQLTSMIASLPTREDPLDRLFEMVMGYIKWAKLNPAYYNVLRSPTVLEHASEKVLGAAMLIKEEKLAEIDKAQATGWRVDDDPEALKLHVMSLASGTATLLTGSFYNHSLEIKPDEKVIATSLRLFLTR